MAGGVRTPSGLLAETCTGRQLDSAWNIYRVPVGITGPNLPDPARLFRNQ
jgi:hypothetical protein